ncbi:MAG TPA: hypothetical protein VFN29_00825 [Chiayiivirga sp.]|nr:hypothetical protein [Chiayiivirga sp.]
MWPEPLAGSTMVCSGWVAAFLLQQDFTSGVAWGVPWQAPDLGA